MVEGQRGAIAVRVEGVRKVFGGERNAKVAVALEEVTLDFVAGAFTTLLGPSGCGKTTLLRVIAGFTPADKGKVWIAGREVGGIPAWKRNIGFCFQNYALWPHMNVRDNVAYGLRLRKLSRRRARSRADEALSSMGLAGMGDRFPGQLSGGQQQRVALARALVLEPQVLLLDEPLSNLDAKLRIEMRREIRRIQREVGITTIYVTHDQEEALEISDMIAVMNQGRVEQVGVPEEVYRSPRTEFVASFLGTVNLLRGQATADGHLRIGALALPLGLEPGMAGRTLTLAVRPEEVLLYPDGEQGQVRGIVVEASYLGHAWRTLVQVVEGPSLVAYSGQPVSQGQTVSLALQGYALIRDQQASMARPEASCTDHPELSHESGR